MIHRGRRALPRRWRTPECSGVRIVLTARRILVASALLLIVHRAVGGVAAAGHVEPGHDAPLPILPAEPMKSADPAYADQNGRFVMMNRAVRVELTECGVARMIDRRRGVSLLETDSPPDVFDLRVKSPGFSPIRRIAPSEGRLLESQRASLPEGEALILRYALPEGIRTELRILLRENAEIEWQLAVENGSSLEIAEIRLPVLGGCRVGPAGDDDLLFTPNEHQVSANPAGAFADRIEDEGHMRWMALWDDQAGLYLGVEDPRQDDYGFLWGNGRDGRLTLGLLQRILARPGGRWTSAVYRTALIGGDWHEGADIYRRYVGKTLRRPENPPHVRWLFDGWPMVIPAMDIVGWDALYYMEQSREAIAEATPFGGETPGPLRYTPLIITYRQMLDGADAMYCGVHAYPSPVWGSTRELAQKIKLIRALGGSWLPYQNFHLFAPGYTRGPRVGTFAKTRLPDHLPTLDEQWFAQVARYNYDGSFDDAPPGRLGRFWQVKTAMASPTWQAWLKFWAREYRRYGVEGMYYDQIHVVWPNEKLYEGYDTYGSWVNATVDTLGAIREEAFADNPHYIIAGERCNDIYGQYMDINRVCGLVNHPAFFLYCNPDQILADGAGIGGFGEAHGGPERLRYCWQIGARFDKVLEPRTWWLRRAVKSLLYDAQFRDTVGVRIVDAAGKPIEPEYTYHGPRRNAPFRGVIGRWFLFRRDDQRGAVLNLINYPIRDDATVRIDTSEFGPVRSALVWTIDGGRYVLDGKQEGDRYTFKAPAVEMASVVLCHRLRPVVDWDIDRVATGGGEQILRLRIVNLNPEPMSGTATLRLPAGWTAPPPEPFGPLACGELVELAIPVRVPADAAQRRWDLWCDVESDAGTFSAYTFLMVNPPLLADLRGMPGQTHLWLRNLSAEPIEGRLSWVGPQPLTVVGPEGFHVPGRSELTIPIEVDGADQLDEVTEFQANVHTTDQEIDLVRAVFPTVPNGGFELDSAGDRKPDWWTGETQPHKWIIWNYTLWDYQALNLDPAAKVGRTCLRIDPPEPGQDFVVASPLHGWLRPGTTYRASVWIRSKSGEGVYAEVAGTKLGAGETDEQWRQFSTTFTADEGWNRVYHCLHNRSSEPAYFDEFRIEEVREGR